MGCGSSSLKGEKPGDITGEPQDQPAKRVQTNFTDVNFAAVRGSDARRPTMAVAPDEDARQRSKRPSEEVGRSSLKSRGSVEHPAVDETSRNLEPYKSIEELPTGHQAVGAGATEAKIDAINPSADAAAMMPTGSAAVRV